MSDHRKGLTESGRAAIDAANRLRDPVVSRSRQERVLSTYAALQVSYTRPEGGETPADRRKAALEGAGALIVLAELLELQAQ